MMSANTRIAVVLFNLGGPDSPKAVKPFLYNLFKDPAILRVPALLRRPLACLIASRRAGVARGIYAQMGGGSPIVELTNRQAAALEESLSPFGQYKVFTCMRYWHPMAGEVANQVAEFKPDQVVLLPLYPQYSTTTTESSFADWEKHAKKAGIHAPHSKICCYPAEPHFAAAHATLIREAYWQASEEAKPRVLFSAHGLPEKIVAGGDPYPWQVEQSVNAITRILGIEELDYRVCYQSRVGPLKWIGPSTDEEIKQAGKDGVPLVVVPVAFVSEHSETLVELDKEYAHLAEKSGVPRYVRVPALGVQEDFIACLSELARRAAEKKDGLMSGMGAARFCPPEFGACPCRAQAEAAPDTQETAHAA